MKFRALLFLTVFFSFNAFAAIECRMDHPIDIGGMDLVESGLFLEEVGLDQVPRFTEPENYDPSTDKLELHIFSIEWNSQPSKKLGVSLRVHEGIEAVGFAGRYFGNFDLKGHKSEADGVTTYSTTLVQSHSESHYAENDAIVEAKVVVEGSHLISVELTFPVYEVWKKDQVANYIEFTGEHQTVCVK